MAYAALISLAQTIDQILNSDQYSIALPERNKIMSINKHVTFLQAFLENFQNEDNSVEGRIRDVANEAEDVIEYFMLEKIRSRKRLINWTLGQSRVKFENQLEEVNAKVNSIAGEVTDIQSRFKTKDEQLSDFSAASSSSELPPYTGKDVIVGFDDHLMTIKERLCGESSKRQVIPILGMGGIGKTTLARYAYDDPLIMYHFHIRAWVTVSQDYSAQEILSCLLDSMKEFYTQGSGQSNGENVYKTLKGRRYLIVMDDMWTTEAWDDVRMFFPDDANGSRVMLTTRLLDVATYPDSSSSPHEMHFMDADESWNLLRQKVFAHDVCPPQLVRNGKEIAKMCGGLPLGIVVIAGVLSMASKTPASWWEIAKNINSAIARKDGQFKKILSLSYIHLPYHLRPCFLYMGLFPEDHEIRVSRLIKLWVAEGFVKSENGSKSLEEAAEEYLEDLVKRSLLLVTKRKSNGKIKSCSVHDLMRDLCITKAMEEKFFLSVMDRHVLPEGIKDKRRISIAHFGPRYAAKIKDSNVRTVISYPDKDTFYERDSLDSLGNYRLLRLFDMSIAGAYFHLKVRVQPPDGLFNLFYLRYLALNSFNKIPSKITNLQNLQTLIIDPVPSNHKTCLPSEIWSLPQLRHLKSEKWVYLAKPGKAAVVLENLQTLSGVVNLECSERNLKLIPNVEKLGIFYCYEEDKKDYQLHNLASLLRLEKLKLGSLIYSARKLNISFPRTLRKLNLGGMTFSKENMMNIGSLPNLEVLKLRNYYFEGYKWETNEGEFPSLKYLLIRSSSLEHWITESSHFPCLKCLLLHRCSALSEIPDGIAEIPTLELIELKVFNESLKESAKQIQEEQRSLGNDALQVRILG